MNKTSIVYFTCLVPQMSVVMETQIHNHTYNLYIETTSRYPARTQYFSSGFPSSKAVLVFTLSLSSSLISSLRHTAQSSLSLCHSPAHSDTLHNLHFHFVTLQLTQTHCTIFTFTLSLSSSLRHTAQSSLSLC